jgi:hypothetical protein
VRHVFIDTNVYLDFFRFGQDDLEELRKLRVAIDNRDVRLWTTSHANDELRRNREARIAESLEALRKQKPERGIPQMARNLAEFGRFMAARREFDVQLNALQEKLTQEFDEGTLAADRVLRELMDAAETIEVTEEILDAARRRVDLGNPPGKRGALGDAVNWESLLRACARGQDLYFITQDGDFLSKMDRERFSGFLADEWREAKASEVRLYKRISEFFRDHFPNIRLATELEKEIRIRRLIDSGSFARTHSAISALSVYTEFTQQEAKDLVAAAVSNSQIRAIAQDSDVNDFFATLVETHRDRLDPDDLERFDRYFLVDDDELDDGDY